MIIRRKIGRLTGSSKIGSTGRLLLKSSISHLRRVTVSRLPVGGSQAPISGEEVPVQPLLPSEDELAAPVIPDEYLTPPAVIPSRPAPAAAVQPSREKSIEAAIRAAESLTPPRAAPSAPVRRQSLSESDRMPPDLQALFDAHKRLGHIDPNARLFPQSAPPPSIQPKGEPESPSPSRSEKWSPKPVPPGATLIRGTGLVAESDEDGPVEVVFPPEVRRRVVSRVEYNNEAKKPVASGGINQSSGAGTDDSSEEDVDSVQPIVGLSPPTVLAAHDDEPWAEDTVQIDVADAYPTDEYEDNEYAHIEPDSPRSAASQDAVQRAIRRAEALPEDSYVSDQGESPAYEDNIRTDNFHYSETDDAYQPEAYDNRRSVFQESNSTRGVVPQETVRRAAEEWVETPSFVEAPSEDERSYRPQTDYASAMNEAIERAETIAPDSRTAPSQTPIQRFYEDPSKRYSYAEDFSGEHLDLVEPPYEMMPPADIGGEQDTASAAITSSSAYQYAVQRAIEDAERLSYPDGDDDYTPPPVESSTPTQPRRMMVSRPKAPTTIQRLPQHHADEMRASEQALPPLAFDSQEAVISDDVPYPQESEFAPFDVSAPPVDFASEPFFHESRAVQRIFDPYSPPVPQERLPSTSDEREYATYFSEAELPMQPVDLAQALRNDRPISQSGLVSTLRNAVQPSYDDLTQGYDDNDGMIRGEIEPPYKSSPFQRVDLAAALTDDSSEEENTPEPFQSPTPSSTREAAIQRAFAAAEPRIQSPSVQRNPEETRVYERREQPLMSDFSSQMGSPVRRAPEETSSQTSSDSETEQEDQKVEKMARAVYDVIRRRLRIERERLTSKNR